MSKNPLQRPIASYVLALVTLCALTVSSIAKAEDCDTPSAESCACQSQMGKSDSEMKQGSGRVVAVGKVKNPRQAVTKPPPIKERAL